MFLIFSPRLFNGCKTPPNSQLLEISQNGRRNVMSKANLIVLSPTHALEPQENCPEKPSDYTPAWNVPTTILGSLTLLVMDSHSNKLKRNCLFYPSSLNYAYHAFSLYTMSSEKCIIVFWFQYFWKKMSNSNKRFAIILISRLIIGIGRLRDNYQNVAQKRRKESQLHILPKNQL